MIKKKKQEIEQGMKSARGRETSQISMIKVRESRREREGAGGSEREREEVKGSGKEWEGLGRRTNRRNCYCCCILICDQQKSKRLREWGW